MTVALVKPSTNGTTEKVAEDRHHGIPVLRLHVDDPIPRPRAPQRYAVRVYPDLARYLLTFNHPQNRKRKPAAIEKYARDMAQGYWSFTPESIVFSQAGILEDGQNRLFAVEQSGASVWLMFDFGWPSDLIERINRGSSRTNADAFSVNGYKYATVAASVVGVVRKFDQTVGTPNRWSQRLLTPSEALEDYRTSPEAYDLAAAWGTRLYGSTQGLGPTAWAAAYFVIAKVRGRETADAFFQEVVDETGEAGSASRKLKSHYLRRRLSDTASGDSREPIENIVRAFNAWATHKPAGFVRVGGAFVLTPVRKG